MTDDFVTLISIFFVAPILFQYLTVSNGKMEMKISLQAKIEIPKRTRARLYLQSKSSQNDLLSP